MGVPLKKVLLVVGAISVVVFVAGMVPCTTPVWKYVTIEITSGNRPRDIAQFNDLIAKNYPGWKYSNSKGDGGYKVEPLLITRNVSFFQMIYWKLTRYVV